MKLNNFKKNAILEEDERLSGLEIDHDKIDTLFKVVPPFTKTHTGFGYIGVLLLDKEKDKLQCSICGQWFKSLSTHLRAHFMSAKQYREEFSLPKNYPLICKSTSRLHSIRSLSQNNLKRLATARKKSLKEINHGKFKQSFDQKSQSVKKGRRTEAFLNSHGLCKKQILSRYYIVCDIVGKPCSFEDIKKYDQSLHSAIRRRFDNKFNNFKKEYGISGVIEKPKEVTREMAIASIRKAFFELGKNPTSNYFRCSKGKYPNDGTIRRIFGSWRKALFASGLDPDCKKNGYKHGRKINN